MTYQVIARKWRPQKFSDLVGQEHVTDTLANAIKKDRVAHSYIFSGARGVGKTTAARILAKALNCAKGPTPEPCGECDACIEITAGNSLDVIEIDAASNRGIDQIRELREMVRYAPAAARTKVVILDEAHMLTTDASNALLKTLEEPPDRVIFVMATTEPEELVDTIRSRSQHFHFRVLTFNEITDRLKYIAEKENLKIEDGALSVIARMAEGSMRDALSLLEQARAYCGDDIKDIAVRELLGVVPEDALQELVEAIAGQSAERALGLVRAVPTVSWLDPRNRTIFDVLGSYGKITETGTPTIKSAIFHADAERDEYFTKRVYALAQMAFDHNFSQDLQLQQIYGGGLGWTVFNRPRDEFDLKGTLQYERQQFISTPSASDNLIGSTFAVNYILHTKPFTYTQGLAYIPAWNNLHAYSANETNTLAITAYKHFGFSVGTIDTYLNNPPASIPPTKRNSFQFTMGLTYAIQSKY